ncbi:MAG: Pentapeptide repeats (9 copies) [Candidatus Argoarchaeum ethanivorans]|uniref:Pentapeptide repeats (9 copies) n=1 Tax=Candidatus Argoarchaeum ethanivorans TaxID=2608793 RepID=A0A811TEV6_9EURY|nr:MAG: Pentapeptide repeats (9 copies) [Candidatus Argoarchaeum ethanivorans]
MKCQYKHPWNEDYVCSEEALPDSKEHFCIFHEQRKDKDVGEFHEKINEKIAQEDFNFTGYFFPDGVSFRNIEFTEEADFEDATFTKLADFRSAIFTKLADFSSTIFKEKAYFWSAIFTKVAIFEEATFKEKAYFMGAIFKEKADFWGATFKEKADFEDATFTKLAIFGYATFKEEAIFGYATFSGITYFRNLRFKKELSFEYTFFSESTQIRLHPKCNLSKASFNGSNCDRVDFSGSKWSADNKGEIIIFEEKEGIKHHNERVIDYQATEEIYRRLKQSHQRFGDHARAGKFYYREMESRRKHQKETKQWVNWIWNGILRFTCGYGERPLYTIFLSGLIILLLAFFYLFGGIVHITNGTETIINYDLATRLTPNLTQLFHDFLWALYTSIVTFTSLGYGDLHPTGWSRLAASIEVCIGVFMVALFLFVFTRKMVR